MHSCSNLAANSIWGTYSSRDCGMQTTSISGVTLREAVRSLLCFEQGVCVAAASGLAVASECCPAERILSARLLLTSCTPAPCAV